MPVRVLDHPLAAAAVTRLRDRATPLSAYPDLARRVGLLLAADATADLPTLPETVATPLETAAGCRPAPVVAVAVLRAGLGLLEAVRMLLPEASVGVVGLARDEETAEARRYYDRLPDMRGARVLVLDPMLATGGSASQAIELLRTRGATDIHLLCVVAAPEGLARLGRDHPDVVVHVAAVDRALDARSFIRPGLGDFGDRLFGT